MAVIAEFSVDRLNVAFGHVFDSFPDAAIELDRVVPTDEGFLPYFWIWSVDDVDDVMALLRDADLLTDVELVDDVDDGGLFRGQWTSDLDGVFEAMERSDLTLRKAVGSAEQWLFELRAETAEDLPDFQHYLEENDLDVTLVRLHPLDEDASTRRYNLTAEQRDALLLAYNEGYYEPTGETTLSALADELGISRSAFGARLKRGYRNLIEATIAHEQVPDESDRTTR